MTEQERLDEKEKLIHDDLRSIENRVSHAFNQGYEMGLKHRLKTGHWESYCYQNNRCSVCGYIIADSDTDEFKYCPNCGARMGVEE